MNIASKPTGTKIALWEVDNGTTTFGTFVASVLSQQDKAVSVSTIYDTYCNCLPTGLVYTTVNFSSPSLPLSQSSDGVSLIVCLDLNLFNVYQLLNGLPDGGHLIINLPTEGKPVLAELEAVLSPSVKRHLAAHKVKVHVVDAKKIRQEVSSVIGVEMKETEDDLVRTIIAASFFNVTYQDTSYLNSFIAQSTTQASIKAYDLAIDLATKLTVEVTAPESWIDIPIDVNEEETRPVSQISNVLPHSEFLSSTKKILQNGEIAIKPWYYSAWHLIFKHSYDTTSALRHTVRISSSSCFSSSLLLLVLIDLLGRTRIHLHCQIDENSKAYSHRLR